MSNSTEGVFGIVLILAHIAAWIFTGATSWDWIEPDSFFGAIKFLIVWGVLGFLARMVIMGVAVVIAKGME